jgi:hypothetical protein
MMSAEEGAVERSSFGRTLEATGYRLRIDGFEALLVPAGSERGAASVPS